MSSDSSVPETPAPEVPAQPVEQPPVAPPPPVPEPAPTPASDDPKPAFWLTRRYFGRSFGFDWHGTYIEGSFHKLDGGQIDCDGLYGGQEYESTTNLLQLIPMIQQSGLVDKIRSFLK